MMTQGGGRGVVGSWCWRERSRSRVTALIYEVSLVISAKTFKELREFSDRQHRKKCLIKKDVPLERTIQKAG